MTWEPPVDPFDLDNDDLFAPFAWAEPYGPAWHQRWLESLSPTPQEVARVCGPEYAFAANEAYSVPGRLRLILREMVDLNERTHGQLNRAMNEIKNALEALRE